MVSLDDDLLGLVLLAATDGWREHNTLSCCIMVNRNWRDHCSPNKTQEYYLWVRRNAPTCIPRIVVQRLIREAACAHSNLRYFQTAPRFSRDAIALLHTELEQFACELLAGSNPLYEAILRGDTVYHPDLFPSYLEAVEPVWIPSPNAIEYSGGSEIWS